MLRQRADRLCLVIPGSYRRFPDWDGQLPEIPDGVTLLRAPDRGPASKMLPIFRIAPDVDVLILFREDVCLVVIWEDIDVIQVFHRLRREVEQARRVASVQDR